MPKSRLRGDYVIVRHRSPTLPDLIDRFIFMTGGAFTQQAKDFLGGVSHPVVEKPFDIRALRLLVSRAVA